MADEPYIVITDLDGTTDDVKFNLEETHEGVQWQVVDTGSVTEKKFTLTGSMGETVCHHRGDCPNVFFGLGFDNSSGVMRLAPAVTVAEANLDVSYLPLTFWEDWDADGDRAVYVYYRDTSTTPDLIVKKIRVSDDAVVDTETSGAAADTSPLPKLGKATTFEGVTHIPSGDDSGTNYARSITTVGDISGGTADTYSESTDAYSHTFAVVQDETASKLVRVVASRYTTAAAISSPMVMADFGDAWEIGDSSTGVQWSLESSDGGIFFCKADGLFTADPNGNTYPVLDLNYNVKGKLMASYDDADGHMADIIGSAILFPSRSGLRRYDILRRKQAELGVDQTPGFHRVQNVSNIPIGLRHYAVAHKPGSQWLYAIYKPPSATAGNSADVHILCGYYDPLAPQEITWRTFLYFTKDVIGLFVDSGNRLWWVEDPQDPATVPGTPSADLSYITLEADGSPRTALGASRGVKSTTYTLELPEVRFDEKEQLRYIKVETESFDATTSLQMGVHRDGAASASVGSAIISDDLHQVEWTVGTADICRRARVNAVLTTNANYVVTKDPRIHLVTLGVRSPDIYKAVFKTGNSIDSARTERKRLRQRKGGGLCQVKESWSGEQFIAQVVSTKDLKATRDPDGNLQYRTEVMFKRWDVEA